NSRSCRSESRVPVNRRESIDQRGHLWLGFLGWAKKERMCYSAALMARRYDHREDGTMSLEEIRDMRNGLSHLSGSAMRHAYQTAYSRCRMVNDRVPSARSIPSWFRSGNSCGSADKRPCESRSASR